MARKAVRKSARYEQVQDKDGKLTPPEVVLDWDPREYYERALIQGDEMYRKYRWQVAEGGLYEDKSMEKLALKAHAMVAKIKRQNERYEESMNTLITNWGLATGYKRVKNEDPPTIDKMSQDMLYGILIGAMGSDWHETVSLLKTVEEATARIIGLSVQINFMFTRFVDAVDLDKTRKPKL